MSSHFSRQIRRAAVRAAVNDVLQGSTWSFTAFHKSVPTSFRRESLKRNHGNYMFAQGKWNRTFLSIFSSLPSSFFFFFFLFLTPFTLSHWLTMIHPLMSSSDSHGKIFYPVHPDFLSCSPWLWALSTKLYLLTCGALKKKTNQQDSVWRDKLNSEMPVTKHPVAGSLLWMCPLL